jgi:hypothetical protein
LPILSLFWAVLSNGREPDDKNSTILGFTILMTSLWLGRRAMAECSMDVESAFGPIVSNECLAGLDFTLFFEETILTLPVTLFFLLWAVPRIFYLRQQTKKVEGGYWHFVKLVRSSILRQDKITSETKETECKE